MIPPHKGGDIFYQESTTSLTLSPIVYVESLLDVHEQILEKSFPTDTTAPMSTPLDCSSECQPHLEKQYTNMLLCCAAI